PATIGAFIYETYKTLKSESLSLKFEWTYVIGFLVALVVGYLALWILMKLLKEGKFYIFSIYTFIVGLSALIF
ncbi:MAG: undecaprenyl-diphosphate phosphatase, partial [Brevinematia bacterium]